VVSKNSDQPIAFRGFSILRIDNKGRLYLPTRYRSRMTPSLVISYDNERNCLRLSLKKFNPENCRDTLKETSFLSNVEVNVNKDGHIYLPKSFLAKTGISNGSNVVLVGGLNHLEIWTESAWDAFENQPQSDDAIKSLDDLFKLEF
jgi:MraZ protein